MKRNRAIVVQEPALVREMRALARRATAADERAKKVARGELPARKKPVRREHELAKQVATWVRENAERLPLLALVYAIPNETGIGGRGGAIVGARFKAEGRRKGVPDYHLPASRLKAGVPWRGLWIELKDETGELSREQRWWLGQLAYEGHACFVARSAEGAITVLEWYAGNGVHPESAGLALQIHPGEMLEGLGETPW